MSKLPPTTAGIAQQRSVKAIKVMLKDPIAEIDGEIDKACEHGKFTVALYLMSNLTPDDADSLIAYYTSCGYTARLDNDGRIMLIISWAKV